MPLRVPESQESTLHFPSSSLERSVLEQPPSLIQWKEKEGIAEPSIRKQREWLRSVPGCRALSYCGSGLMPEATHVRMAEVSGRIRTNGTLFCRSPRCSRCSRLLSKERSTKITRVLCSDEVEGLKPYFITLTFQSFAGSALEREEAKRQIDRFSRVWRRSQKSKRFLPPLSISVVEVTHGREHNMHVHAHIIGFYDGSFHPEETVNRWLSSVKKEGLVALRSSQCVKEVSLEDKSRLAAYMAKGSTVAGVAFEMQGSEWKSGSLALLLSAEKGSVEHKAYCAMMPALVSTKLRTWRPSKAFRELLAELEMNADDSTAEMEEEELEESSGVLMIGAGAWKEANRLRLPSSLLGNWRFTIRDLLEDLLLAGDVFLAEDVVSVVDQHQHYRSSLSRKEYQDRLWLKLETLLL